MQTFWHLNCGGGVTADHQWPPFTGRAIRVAKHSPWWWMLALIYSSGFCFQNVQRPNVNKCSWKIVSIRLNGTTEWAVKYVVRWQGCFSVAHKRLTSWRCMVPVGRQHHSAELSLGSRGGDKKVLLIHWMSWSNRMVPLTQQYVFILS